MIAVGIGEARGVEPIEGHPLAVSGRIEEAVDELFVGVGAVVFQKGVDFPRSRWQARQVERCAADERGLVGFRCRFQALFVQPGQNEPIDRIAGPRLVLNGGEGGTFGGLERPVGLVTPRLGRPIP